MSTVKQRNWSKYNKFFTILREEARAIRALEEQAKKDFLAGNIDEQEKPTYTDEDFDFGGGKNYGSNRKNNILNRFSFKRYCEYMDIMSIITNPIELENAKEYLKLYNDAYKEALEERERARKENSHKPVIKLNSAWMIKYRNCLNMVEIANNHEKVMFMERYLERYADDYHKTRKHGDKAATMRTRDGKAYAYTRKVDASIAE